MTLAVAAKTGAKRSAAKASSKRTVLLKQDVRGAKAIESHRTQERAKLRNYETIERVAEEQQVLASKTREYRKRRSEVSTESNAAAGRNVAYSNAGKIIHPGSGSNPFILILSVWFIAIVFYAMVTRPQPTTTFLGSLSDWLSLISTSTPIFQKKGS
jgi:hypothetical protein